jgi:hypothetical protein
MDQDEIGGPNDQYEFLGSRALMVSDLWYVIKKKYLSILQRIVYFIFLASRNCLYICSLDFIIEDMTKCLDESYFRVLLSREWLTFIYRFNI